MMDTSKGDKFVGEAKVYKCKFSWNVGPNGKSLEDNTSDYKAVQCSIKDKKFVGIMAYAPHRMELFIGKDHVFYASLSMNKNNTLCKGGASLPFKIFDVKLFAQFDRNGKSLRYCIDEVQDAVTLQKIKANLPASDTNKMEALEAESFFRSQNSFLCDENNSRIETQDEAMPKTLNDYIKIHKKDIYKFDFELDFHYILYKKKEASPMAIPGKKTPMPVVFNCPKVIKNTLKPNFSFNGKSFAEIFSGCMRYPRIGCAINNRFRFAVGPIELVQVSFLIYNNGEFSIFFWKDEKNTDVDKGCTINGVKIFTVFEINGMQLRYCLIDKMQYAKKEDVRDTSVYLAYYRKGNEKRKPLNITNWFDCTRSFLCDGSGLRVGNIDANTPKTITDCIRANQKDIYKFHFDLEFDSILYESKKGDKLEITHIIDEKSGLWCPLTIPKGPLKKNNNFWNWKFCTGNFDKFCALYKRYNRHVKIDRGRQFSKGIMKLIPHVMDIVLNVDRGEFAVSLWLNRENKIIQPGRGQRSCYIFNIRLSIWLENKTRRYGFAPIPLSEKDIYEQYVIRKSERPYEDSFVFHSSWTFLCDSNYRPVYNQDRNTPRRPRTITDYIRIHKTNISSMLFDTEIEYLLDNNVERAIPVIPEIKVTDTSGNP